MEPSEKGAYLPNAVSQNDGYTATHLALHLRIMYIFHTPSLAEIGLKRSNSGC